MGEVLATLPLVREIRAQCPKAPLFVSTGTLAGQATAREKLAGLAAGIFYAPLDYCFAVRGVLRTIQPSVLVVAETEIWPNLFREARRAGCGVMIVNGRISDKAWPSYLRLKGFFRAVLPATDMVLAQSAAMRDRYRTLGANAEDGGNLKYDFHPQPAPPESPVRALLNEIRPAKVWIAASTMPPNEDDLVIETFQQLPTGTFLILAPRKPEQFDVAAAKLTAAGIPFVRRSELPRAAPGVRALLLDSMGELAGLFALADAVFMGGSIVQRGGHNILEPALFGCPVVVGPHMENFSAIAADFLAAGACRQIASGDELTAAVAALLRDPGDMGALALACAEAKRGATARAVVCIRELYERRYPFFRPRAYWLLAPLSKLWDRGARNRQGRYYAEMRRLDSWVVSVGNLSMGGTGKTPVVLWLAARMPKPGILTRGYGRHSPESQLVLDAGARIPIDQSGDEPQMFLRSGLAPVGIASNRYLAGRALEERFPVETILLDDGFQHVRIGRDVDLVLIDALNPFNGGRSFPLGRLREPLAALARADVFLITRADCGRNLEAVEHLLRQYNPRAPVFHSRVKAQCWVERATGREVPLDELPARRVGAFCGLGNPGSFWSTLESLGISTLLKVDYEDHHTYRPKELVNMRHQFLRLGAEAAVTTEKDNLNLCEACDQIFAPLPVYWLKIEAGIADEQRFLRSLMPRRRLP